MRHIRIISAAAIAVVFSATLTAAPAAGDEPSYVWQEIKAVVDSVPGAGITMTTGAADGTAFIAVTGSRSYLSGQNFFTHRGTTYSQALCRASTGALRIGTETVQTNAVSGTGNQAISTVTVKANAASCRSNEALVGVLGAFGWGAPGERFADRVFNITVYLPNHPSYGSVTNSPQVERLPDQIAPDSAYLVSLAALLVTTRGSQEEACMALGQSARTHAARSSVPDITLVCRAQGVAKALQFMLLTGITTLQIIATVTTVYDALNNPALDPNATDLECDEVDSTGGCLPEGFWNLALGGPEPEPEPAPAGSSNGVPPPPNCLDNNQRNSLLDSMGNQDHHMATRYGDWSTQFQDLVNSYGLSVVDTAHAWNVHSVPQSGPHPWNYHNWVLQNMRNADNAAQAYPEDQQREVFLELFDEWVVQRVLADPTILRAGYWDCHPGYRWN